MTNSKIERLPAQHQAVLQRILAITAAAMLPAVPMRALPARQGFCCGHKLKQVSILLNESNMRSPPYT